MKKRKDNDTAVDAHVEMEGDCPRIEGTEHCCCAVVQSSESRIAGVQLGLSAGEFMAVTTGWDL